jgi:hypothetical protein
MSFKTFKQLTNQTIKGAALLSLAQASAGADEFNALVMTGAFVDGDTFTIDQGSWTGRAHYEFNTDTTSSYAAKFVVKLLGASALTLGDASLNTTNAGVQRGVTITAHGMVQGSVFGVGTEFFRVLRVQDVNTVDVLRGYGGSTVAAHASAAAVLTPANYTNVNLPYDFVVPVTALALATSGPQIAAFMPAVDGFNPKWNGGQGYGIQQSLSARAFGFDWEYDATNTRLFFHRAAQGNNAGNTTLTFTEVVTNGTFATASLTPGTQIGEVKTTAETRVPTAAEVTAGLMDFAFPYPVKNYQVLASTTTTDAPATVGSTVSFSADFRRLTLKNNGTNNFAATDTITVKAYF